jgi:hypothetical protein
MLDALPYRVPNGGGSRLLALATSVLTIGCVANSHEAGGVDVGPGTDTPATDGGRGEVPSHDAEDPGDAPPTTVSFARDIFPIVEKMACSQIAGCHNDSRSPTAHYSDYRTLEMTYRQWTQGAGFDHCPKGEGPSITVPPPEPRLIPGKPEESLIIRKLTETRLSCAPFYGRMPPPPFPPLSAEQIDTIRIWIREGARNN